MKDGSPGLAVEKLTAAVGTAASQRRGRVAAHVIGRRLAVLRRSVRLNPRSTNVAENRLAEARRNITMR